MKIVATLMSNGVKFYLRSTVWTADIDRATRFDDITAAKEQVNKAAKFMNKSLVKTIDIEEVEA